MDSTHSLFISVRVNRTFGGPDMKLLPPQRNVRIHSTPRFEYRIYRGKLRVSNQCVLQHDGLAPYWKCQHNEPVATVSPGRDDTLRTRIHTRMNNVDTEVQGLLYNVVRNMLLRWMPVGADPDISNLHGSWAKKVYWQGAYLFWKCKHWECVSSSWYIVAQ